MANYCTLNELKAALSITDNIDDSVLQTAITSASTWVDGWCYRSFEAAGTGGTAVTDRDYIPTGTFEPLFIDDCVEIVQVRLDDDLDGTFADTLTAVDFQAEPVNATTGGLALPFTRLRPFEDGYWPTFRGQATVRVSARYGWPGIPDAVREATIFQASRLFTRRDSPLGVAGFGDMGAMRVSRFVDPDVEMLLAPYRKWQAA
jgi:hypothetical protein